MICPDCQADYLDNLTECGDCKVNLIDACAVDLPIPEMTWRASVSYTHLTLPTILLV